jgi:hypothetical protein
MGIKNMDAMHDLKGMGISLELLQLYWHGRLINAKDIQWTGKRQSLPSSTTGAMNLAPIKVWEVFLSVYSSQNKYISHHRWFYKTWM